MSYRRAWLLIDDMNQCFRHAVVSAQAGRLAGRRRGADRIRRGTVRDNRAIETAAAVGGERKRLRGHEAAVAKISRTATKLMPPNGHTSANDIAKDAPVNPVKDFAGVTVIASVHRHRPVDSPE